MIFWSIVISKCGAFCVTFVKVSSIGVFVLQQQCFQDIHCVAVQLFSFLSVTIPCSNNFSVLYRCSSVITLYESFHCNSCCILVVHNWILCMWMDTGTHCCVVSCCYRKLQLNFMFAICFSLSSCERSYNCVVNCCLFNSWPLCVKVQHQDYFTYRSWCVVLPSQLLWDLVTCVL